MAIKKEARITGFLSVFIKRSLTIAAIISFLSAVLLSWILFTFNDQLSFWLTVLIASLMIFTVNGLIVWLASQPLSLILQNLAQKLDQPVKQATKVKVPSYIRKNLEAQLLKIPTNAPVAQTKTAAKLSDKTESTVEVQQRLRGSVVTLDWQQNIIYASAGAPLQTVDGKLQLQLLFSGDYSLDQWLQTCHQNAIKAERIWRRVPDRPADQKDQKIYDVFADYQKGANPELVLTLVNQTDLYQSDEEALNFIAFAAHELRGPITVIRGYSDVLRDELRDKLDQDQKELFARLVVSANRLSGYVNNILNTARYDRRHLVVNLREDQLSKVYDSISDDMQLRAQAQNRILAVQIPEDLPTIAADRSSLTEVISNLVDNALKYSFEGGVVQLSARLRGDFIELAISDSGIGMPPSVIKNLFQKFYRSHRSRETVAGTGIGLYISKAIVESHGGTISVKSEEGKGSTFTVLLPTYASVADKITAGGGTNQNLINRNEGWIKNHSMYRG